MLLVGLTGGIGSGKSTVARMLGRRGAIVFDADDLARAAIAPGSPGLDRVIERFGSDILTAEGEVDRQALADRVFAHPEDRRVLESIVHPEVFRLLAEAVEPYRETDTIVVFDAPLIVETGFHEACDVLVVVSAPVEQQVTRVMAARGMTADQARARIAAQLSTEDKERVSTFILVNDGSLDDLQERVDGLWEDLRAWAARIEGR